MREILCQKPKGTIDNFGSKMVATEHVENVLKKVAQIFNYKQVRTPTFEAQVLFNETVGSSTDVVVKQMYNFVDKKNRKLTLRPEGTLPIVRFFVENKLYNGPGPHKFYYLGPMYRYERPQKGRQREFRQFGIEFISKQASPYTDAEVILMAKTILDFLKVSRYCLEINFLGGESTRLAYERKLTKFLTKHKNSLEADSQIRLVNNPLRILDDKKEQKKHFFSKLPLISDFYTQNEQDYFDKLKQILYSLKVAYVLNPKLVRGLDYYGGTVFEFFDLTGKAGAQNTIIGGGSYEKLFSKLGGSENFGSGFAIGMSRLVSAYLATKANLPDAKTKSLDVYVINLHKDTLITSFALVNSLRQKGFRVDINQTAGKLSKLLPKSASQNACFVAIIGKKEALSKTVVLKDQKNHSEEIVKIKDLGKHLAQKEKTWKK